MPLQPYRFSFRVMAGPAEVELYAESKDAATEVAALIEAEARRIEQKFSRYQSESIVSRINAQAGLAAVEVDAETAGLLQYAAACFEQSDGLFDVTSGVLRKVWNFKAARVPTLQEIESVLPLIGWDKVEWKPPFVRLSQPGMEIDFGGFGKEYAVDRCAALALERGVHSGFVNFAGDLRVLGRHPDGRPYRFGLVHPRRDREVFASVELLRGALATSGDYERFFERDGRRYCHILNPRTGYPVEGLQSVSVAGDSCLVCGSACTIAILFGAERGEQFLAALGAPFVIRRADGSVESDSMHHAVFEQRPEQDQ